MAVTAVHARRALDLSRKLRELGDHPREVGSEHMAAQSSMASLGYELAGVFTDALAGAEDPLSERLAVAKSLAQEVLEEYPAEAYGSAWLEQAVELMGRCESEIEESGR